MGKLDIAEAVIEGIGKGGDLAMDFASRMKRAGEQGFDTSRRLFHGSPHEFKAFSRDTIGSQNDDGFFGRGFYFAPDAGEANYYGDNVREFLSRGNLLDLEHVGDDLTSTGRFREWAPKLDEIGALEAPQKRALDALTELDEFVDGNVRVVPLRGARGEEGFRASINLDRLEDGQKYAYEFNSDGHFVPETEAQAIKSLKERLIYELGSRDEGFGFKGLGDIPASLSDYVRADSKGGSSALTEKARAAGFDGINAAGETVVFDPENIRLIDAAFDPANAGKNDLLGAVSGAAPYVAAGALGVGAAVAPGEAEAGVGKVVREGADAARRYFRGGNAKGRGGRTFYTRDRAHAAQYGDVEEYLVDPKRVFDTRNPEHRAIFESEFYRKYGNGAPLNDQGLPDWTDAEDFEDFFKERGYEFDSVAIGEPPAQAGGGFTPRESLMVFDEKGAATPSRLAATAAAGGAGVAGVRALGPTRERAVERGRDVIAGLGGSVRLPEGGRDIVEAAQNRAGDFLDTQAMRTDANRLPAWTPIGLAQMMGADSLRTFADAARPRAELEDKIAALLELF